MEKFFQDIALTLPEPLHEGIFFEQKDAFSAEIRRIGSAPALQEFELKENYAARRDPKPDDLALECRIFLFSANHPDWKSLRIGCPLSELPEGAALSLRYTGTEFQLLADGEILSRQYPYGDLLCERKRFSAHGWTPPGLNTWVGDVSLGVFRNELHLFYLYDVRHHSSRFGTGAHSWGHMVTADLKHWRDDGVVLPLEENWQSYGTGTPVEVDGKIVLTYGFHSERALPEVPALGGATWAESRDGRHFYPSGKIFAGSRNPSIYNLPDGRFRMIYGFAWDQNTPSIWEAEHFPDFHPVCQTAIPSKETSLMRNNMDCPCWFEHGGTHYLLMGFTGMWRADNPRFDKAEDLSAQGLAFYDGLSVPMVTRFMNRYILAGWLPFDTLWGGCLGLREVIFHPDGIPGLRWMEEAMPEHAPFRPLPCDAELPESFYLEITLRPGEDLRLTFEGDGVPVEFRLKGKEKRASLSYASAKEIPTPDEAARRNDLDGISEARFGTCLAVRNLYGTEQDYKVRFMVLCRRKNTGDIIDCEIASCRTMIRHFPKTVVRRVKSSIPGRLQFAEI